MAMYKTFNNPYRYFEGRNIVLRATHPLSPGEVVSENYGPHFMMRGVRERQRALACRYWFRCECMACKEDWPTLKQMVKDVPPFLRLANVKSLCLKNCFYNDIDFRF